jgi:hypothetical protein
MTRALGLDLRFFEFVIWDISFGLILGSVAVAALAPADGFGGFMIMLVFGFFFGVPLFLINLLPTAFVFSSLFLPGRRRGLTEPVAAAIAAAPTAVAGTLIIFFGGGLLIGHGNMDWDGANAAVLPMAVFSILLAPFTAYRVYRHPAIDAESGDGS